MTPMDIINRKRTSVLSEKDKMNTTADKTQFYKKYRNSLNKEVRDSISFMKW